MDKNRKMILAIAATGLVGVALLRAGTDYSGPLGAVLIGFILLLLISNRIPVRAIEKGEKLKPSQATSSLTFEDVAANEEAIESMRLMVDYLRRPEKYTRLGARMPRGILLYGPPGTGKTLLARALAGEAGVPFYSMNGSDFVQMYAGVGASRVRELFEKARRAKHCVVFVDEIDALGKARSDHSSEERDQTLNALLSELSGFHPRDGILVVAATNRADTLDPALLRPGRFDRQIEVGLPDRRERLEILKLHAKGKPLSDSVDLNRLAASTAQFSGASLENLLNEAALLAAQKNATRIEVDDVDQAFYHVIAGRDKASSVNSDQLAQVALHEAGHAVATHLLLPESSMVRISILPNGRGAAGYNLSVAEEHTFTERSALLKQIQVLLAGRAAECLLNPDGGLTSGAANDLSRAAELSAAMIMDLGMGDEPAVSIRTLQAACGESVGAFNACKKLLQEQMDAVTKRLSLNTPLLTALTEALLREESMNADRIQAFFQDFANNNTEAQANR